MYSKLVLSPHEARVLLAITQHIESSCDENSKKAQMYKTYCQDKDLIPHKMKMHALLNVMGDLIKIGWKFHYSDEQASWLGALDQSILENQSAEEIKKEMRQQLLNAVREDFERESVKDFIHRMELTSNKQLSVSNLIDSSEELISAIQQLDREQDDFAASVISPYIQEANNTRDAFTNLLLQDIWRYFRLSWSLPYKTNPGRSQPFLIRNKARPNHPVIGIAMLASPILGFNPRDEELGLKFNTFLKWAKINKLTLKELLQWIKKDISVSLKNVDSKGIVKSTHIYKPNKIIIDKLAKDEKKLRQTLKEDDSLDSIQRDQYLFNSKKIGALRKLLLRKLQLKELITETQKKRLSIKKIKNNQLFKTVVKDYLTSKRTAVISQDVMDLSTCGAIYPYNLLIGGKLVALLMASKEVYDMFSKKYDNAENEISSKISGRSIKTKPDLKCIVTTSLYGVHSSQYNRLKVTTDGNQKIEYKKLANKSLGFGTFQFSASTQELILELFEKDRVKTVYSDFGEGTSPRLRRLKQALRHIGFMGTDIFKHPQERIVYILDLYKNTTDLIFKQYKQKPKINTASANSISKAWRKRWLKNRAKNPLIIKQLSLAKKRDFLLSKKLEKILNE